MKKSVFTVIIIVILVTLLRGAFHTSEPSLEIYRQAGEGNVELIREITDVSAVEKYDSIYRRLDFVLEGPLSTYPDIAVYRRDDAGFVHHTSVWIFEQGDGVMQEISGSRKAASLTVEEMNELMRVLQLADIVLQE